MLGDFWTKINNDWIFNLAGLLAYNLLMALFPVLLLLLAGCGVLLQIISPSAQVQLQRTLAAALPGTTGAVLVHGVTTHLAKSAGLLLVVGLVSAFLAGSRLFITLENCFGIIFRLRGRDPLRQNRMAFGLLALYLIIVPIVFLVSILPAGLVALIDPHGHSPLGGLLSDGARLLIWFAAALLFCGATYAFVPNRRLQWRGWRRNWRGTVVAAVLLVLYEVLFRVYQQHLLHADNYGTIAAFAIVILLFLYYLAFILLLGAEINSWVAGQRATAADLPGVLHAVQVHRTLRGAAGPTAGMPHEEMQRHSRARLVRYAEAVLRRARAGRPLTLHLPRYRPARQTPEPTPDYLPDPGRSPHEPS
jgi:membrane protein